MKLNTVAAVLMTAFYALITICLAGMIYYRFYEDPFLEYRGLPFIVDGDAYVGKPVRVKVNRCSSDKQMRVYTITHSLVPMNGGAPIPMPADTTQIAPGCHVGYSGMHIVPEDTPPGSYMLEGFAEVQGTLRTFQVRYYSVPFTVRPKIQTLD